MFICRVQDLRELGELSPHWDNLRKEVMTRYGGIISSYQETLAELDKITGTTAPAAKFYIHTCFHTCIHGHTYKVVLLKSMQTHLWNSSKIFWVSLVHSFLECIFSDMIIQVFFFSSVLFLSWFVLGWQKSFFFFISPKGWKSTLCILLYWCTNQPTLFLCL